MAQVRKETDQTPLYKRLDTYGHFRAQGGRPDHIVLYNASDGRPVSCAFCTRDLPLPFIARDKTYWSAFTSKEEAFYVITFLNSEFLTEYIADWLTTGLFGARDIHKRALDMPWPAYDSAEPTHVALAELGFRLAGVASAAARNLRSRDVGRQRTEIQKALPRPDKLEVERLVMAVTGSV